MGRHLEIERSFAPGPDTRLPDLGLLPGVATVSAPETWRLDATYYDTEALDLTLAGISLRRRTGGADEGWHLKVPAAAGRHEQQVPLSRARNAPPAVLRRLVLGRTRTAPLGPVARISTVRTVRWLCRPDGTVLAEVADDRVVAEPFGTDTEPVEWREWEVELVHGDLDLLQAAERLFESASIHPSQTQRKIEIALARRLAGRDTATEAESPSVKAPARLVLQPRLQAQVEELLTQDLLTRRGDESGVHQMRVACRRLRSALATFQPMLDPEAAEPVRRELGWLTTALGAARDAQVVRELLGPLIEEEAGTSDVRTLRRQLDTPSRPADGDELAVLGSERYLTLLDALVDLVAAPPWTPEAGRPAGTVVPRLIARDLSRLRRRHRRALSLREAGDPLFDQAVHDVRKAAKRLRYAAETAEPVWGKEAARLREPAKRVTELLGSRQDTVLTRAELARLAGLAESEGQSTFAHGRLHALEQVHADELMDSYLAYWPQVVRRSTWRWLR